MQTVRIGGHPIHPALVHFPIAFWTAAPLLDGIYLWTRSSTWWDCAFWCIAVGLVTALAAMSAGFVDLLTLPTEHPAQATAQRHMVLVASAWCVFCVDLVLRPLHHQPSQVEALFGLGISLVGFALLGIGGYFGAQLVYDLGVGQRAASLKNPLS